MKSNITLIFTVLSLWVAGQGSFPLSDATWVNARYDVIQMATIGPQYFLQSIENICLTDDDTVINSLYYKKVQVCGVAYRGALRTAAGRVYYVPKHSSKEYLVYDFTVMAGDSVKNVYVENHSNNGLPQVMDLEVSQVNSIQVDGIPRKCIVFKNAAVGKWIEGVGCTQGLFRAVTNMISNTDLSLECMSHNNKAIYPNATSSPCNLMTLVPNNNYVKVYAKVEDANGQPVSNYAVYLGKGSNQTSKPSRIMYTDAQGIGHDSIIPGRASNFYAYVYDCTLSKVLDYEVAYTGIESDSTVFEFVLQCPADTCAIVLSHTVVDTDSNVVQFDYESAGFFPQILSPTWYFSDGNQQMYEPNFSYRIEEPGWFKYCIDVGCSPSQTCDSLYVDPDCETNFFLDTVNSIVFNGDIVFWREAKPGTHFQYGWNFGDGTTSSQPYPRHTYARAGTYKICLTVTYDDGYGNCSHTFCESLRFEEGHLSLQVIDPETIGTEEWTKDQVQYALYPNPATDEITLEWEAQKEIYKIQLYSSTGRLLKEWPGSIEGKQIISLEEIPVGTYIVKAIMRDVAKTIPLIVQ